MLKSATFRGSLLIVAVLGLLTVLKFKATQAPKVVSTIPGHPVLSAKETLQVGFLPVT